MEETTRVSTAAQMEPVAPGIAVKGGRRGGRLLVLAVQVGLSGVLVYLAVRGLNWASLAQMAGRQSAGFFVGAVLLSVAVTLVYVLRWHEVLLAMGHRVALRNLARQVFVGIFFNNFAPSMLGQDAIRTYYLGRDTGYVTAGVSVLVDKIMGLASLTVLGAMLIPLLGLKGPLFAGALTASLLFSLACAVVLLAARLPLERLMPPFLARWSLGRRILDLAQRSRASAGSAVTLRVLAASLGVMAVSMTAQAAIYSWFLLAATGASPSIPALVGALCLVTTVTNMPVSVNGIGVREQAHALILAALGVPLEAAVALSLLQYLLLLAQSLIGWGLWMTRKRSTPAVSL
ncbi:MAG: flippase-like domain-containing protein [Proteobacteria bacterium]|nr:flippase-like domain-containing protein [Pseudomonadota bacterium]MBU1595256.1 flippase-like domain-containing protein [Pseudomonadota bacterium]